VTTMDVAKPGVLRVCCAQCCEAPTERQNACHSRCRQSTGCHLVVTLLPGFCLLKSRRIESSRVGPSATHWSYDGGLVKPSRHVAISLHSNGITVQRNFRQPPDSRSVQSQQHAKLCHAQVGRSPRARDRAPDPLVDMNTPLGVHVCIPLHAPPNSSCPPNQAPGASTRTCMSGRLHFVDSLRLAEYVAFLLLP